MVCCSALLCYRALFYFSAVYRNTELFYVVVLISCTALLCCYSIAIAKQQCSVEMALLCCGGIVDFLRWHCSVAVSFSAAVAFPAAVTCSAAMALLY
jgi:hypothetical protein